MKISAAEVVLNIFNFSFPFIAWDISLYKIEINNMSQRNLFKG